MSFSSFLLISWMIGYKRIMKKLASFFCLSLCILSKTQFHIAYLLPLGHCTIGTTSGVKKMRFWCKNGQKSDQKPHFLDTFSIYSLKTLINIKFPHILLYHHTIRPLINKEHPKLGLSIFLLFHKHRGKNVILSIPN